MHNHPARRRAKASGALLVVFALFTAFFAVSMPAANADVPAPGVTVKATTPTQTNVDPSTATLAGLRNGDTVSIDIAGGTIFGADMRLCRAGLDIQLQSQFNPSPAGNCLANPLPGGGSGFVTRSFGPTNTGGNVTWTVGTGSDAATPSGHVGNGGPIVCDSANPCSLWLKISVPTSVLASGQSWVHYDLTFAGTPDAPTGVVAAGGNGQATVNVTPPVNTGNSPIATYLITSAPGGQTCTATAPATSCTVTGLTNFTPYTFTATATNAAGFTSAPSAPSAPVTPGPVGPSITGTNPGNASVQVTWLAASPAPTDYIVTSTPGGLTCTTTTLSCTVTGLTNGTPYTFVVTANYGASSVSSLPSNPVTPTGQFVTQTFTVSKPAGALLIGENCSTTTAIADPAGYDLGTTGKNCDVAFGTATLNPAGTYYLASAPIKAVKVLDARDTDAGWTVTGSLTPFTSASDTFAACNFGLVPTGVGASPRPAYTQSTTSGPSVDPDCTTATGGYGSSRVLVEAAAGGGLGYSDLTGTANVQIPLSADAGAYTAILTITLLTK